MSKRPPIAPRDRREADRLGRVLVEFSASDDSVPTLRDRELESLVGQILDSQRRQDYIALLKTRSLAPSAMDPASGNFDPFRGAILCERDGRHDEGCWLVFLAVHFGHHDRTGWRLLSDFYGRLGAEDIWDWSSSRSDTAGVRDWLDQNRVALQMRGGRFGNHRKRESLSGWGPSGTGQTIETYVHWVGPGTHDDQFVRSSIGATSPTERFAAMYDSLSSVSRFGRLARFDYLTTLGRVGLADVQPDGLHLKNSTGPRYGADLLLTGRRNSGIATDQLEARLAPLQETLGVGFDVLEDALCNWQKSPSLYAPFRG